MYAGPLTVGYPARLTFFVSHAGSYCDAGRIGVRFESLAEGDVVDGRGTADGEQSPAAVAGRKNSG
jgi:hypothetical protein